MTELENIKFQRFINYPEHNWKYVFALDTIIDIDKTGKKWTYISAYRYRFVKVNDDWKILAIDGGYFNYFEGKKLPHNMTKEEYMKKKLVGFLTFHDKPIEYVKTYNYTY